MVYFPIWKKLVVLFVCLMGLAFLAPNFLPRDESTGYAAGIPDWLPHKQLNLGLDLQGGAHLLVEVDAKNVVKERLEAIEDRIRQDLRAERIGYLNLGIGPNRVGLTIREAARLDQARDILEAIRSENDDQGLVGSLGGEPDIALVEEGARLELVMSESAVREVKVGAVAQTIEILRRRLDETGVKEPSVQRQGTDRIVIQLPGVSDASQIWNVIKETAKMSFQFVDTVLGPQKPSGSPPPGRIYRAEYDANGEVVSWYSLRRQVIVSGDRLVDARQGIDSRTNQPAVFFRFDSQGAKQFADATSKNVGRLFAIVLDDKVISAPVIREPILTGDGQITGSFTIQSASNLAILLRAGALPADLKRLEERTVGSILGEESIKAGKLACIIGMAFVAVFMIASYGLFGIMANVALFVNLVLIGGALSLLQATLTLPGIAGIVLTVGMAVDANVLIFERIREEVRNGRSPISAVDAGYSRALTTIIDSNLTTLIAAVLLFYFGSGPVRGFAVTLSIGIVTSMFTAIMVTRLMVVTWLRQTRPTTVPI